MGKFTILCGWYCEDLYDLSIAVGGNDVVTLQTICCRRMLYSQEFLGKLVLPDFIDRSKISVDELMCWNIR